MARWYTQNSVAKLIIYGTTFLKTKAVTHTEILHSYLFILLFYQIILLLSKLLMGIGIHMLRKADN